MSLKKNDHLSIYNNEEKIIRESKKLLNSDKIDHNLLKSEYKKILEHYQNLLRENKKIIRISDNLERKLLNSQDKLKEANELKTHLLQIAAHDLQNPIAVIKGFTELLLKDTNLDKKKQHFLKLMYGSSEKMLQLIQQLLEDSHVNDLTNEIKKNKVDIILLLNNVVENKKIQAEQKKQTIIFENRITNDNSNNETFILADEDLIVKAFYNILSNAIKYSEFEKKIIIRSERILKNNKKWIKISFIDEGLGFTEEDKKNIFKKFQRLSAKPTNHESSIGLGLYLTKQIIDMHKGNIFLESKKGNGSIINIELLEY